MPPSAKSFLTASSATAIRRFGEQLTWIQEPDIFHIRFSGTLTGPDLQALLDWQKEWGKNKPSFFVLCDLSQVGKVTREARTVLNNDTRTPGTRITSIAFGASFTIRIIAEMAVRARKVLRLPETGDSYFVATNSDAQVLLEELRKKQ